MPNQAPSISAFKSGYAVSDVTLVSTDAAGTPSNGLSDSPVFSPDGTKIIFVSFASNLVTGDSAGIFIKDLTTGAITRSISDPGVQANAQRLRAVFSPEGSRRVHQPRHEPGADDTNSGTTSSSRIWRPGPSPVCPPMPTARWATSNSEIRSSRPMAKGRVRQLGSNLVTGDTNGVPESSSRTWSPAPSAGSTSRGRGRAPKRRGVLARRQPNGIHEPATNLVAGDTNGASNLHQGPRDRRDPPRLRRCRRRAGQFLLR